MKEKRELNKVSGTYLNILVQISHVPTFQTFLFPEITGSEETNSSPYITAIAVGVTVGIATLAIVVIIAAIYCSIKRKQIKSNNEQKEKAFHTEQFVKETDF